MKLTAYMAQRGWLHYRDEQGRIVFVRERNGVTAKFTIRVEHARG